MTERDDQLTELLAKRLPQYPAPLALKRAIAAQWRAAAAPPRAMPWWRRSVVALPAAVALLLIAVSPVVYDRVVLAPASRAQQALTTAAVDSHVRTTRAPLGIVSGGVHDVKPWFTGKLDFAPAVAFMGDDEFPLRGGALGTYGDRPSAVLVFGRRQHTITLSVFRADGLPRLAHESVSIGATRATVVSARGFNVVLWRAGDLGYALVSDVDRAELLALAAKLAANP
jgi:anti-sigma factor RsiW